MNVDLSSTGLLYNLTLFQHAKPGMGSASLNVARLVERFHVEVI